MNNNKRIILYLLALSLSFLCLGLLETRHQQDKETIAALRQEVAQLERLLAEKPIPAPPRDKVDRSGEREPEEPEPELTSLGVYTITAYCSCEKCCGKWAKNRPGGKVYGASGVELIPGISVAAPLSFGAKVVIEGHEYTVHDRTAKWIVDKYDGRIIDVYFADHNAALKWGKKEIEVFMGR